MSVPILIPDLESNTTKLIYPVKLTSIAFPVTKNTPLINANIRGVKAKAITISNSKTPPDYSWIGKKREWDKDSTIVASDFVRNDVEKDSVDRYNLLYNTSFQTLGERFNTINQNNTWTQFIENKNIRITDPLQYKFGTGKPAQGMVWGKPVYKEGKLQYLEFINLKTLKDYTQELLNQKSEKTETMVRNFGDGYNLKISNFENNLTYGICQWIRVEDLTYSDLSFTMKFRTNTIKHGLVARLEFYTEEGILVKIQETPVLTNKSTDTASKYNDIWISPIDMEEKITLMRLCIYTDAGEGTQALVREIHLQEGYNEDPIWTTNLMETAIDLNAGEVDAPMKDGEVDRKEMISDISILRSTLSEGVLSWQEIKRVPMRSIKNLKIYDYFITNGDYYRYAIQPIYTDLDGKVIRKGNITKFKDVVSTFGGLWILGKEDYQFNFIYNGKINNITYKKPQQIVETIGSRYPYFIRNSETDYRSFTLTGTLCSIQDEDELFISDDYSKTISPYSTVAMPEIDIKYENEMFYNKKSDLKELKESQIMQRMWRHKVTDWLNDGEPKVIKSESEGNMLVMLTDVVVQPAHTVYGLVADFTCTATEIGKCDEKTLEKFKMRK